MKLNSQQIKQIDNYLIKLKVKFVDVRLELIDHLATDFEEVSTYALLEDYLKTKIEFINDFVKKRQKTIHWSYQRQLWQQFLMFFHKPAYILTTVLIGFFVYWLQIIQPNKTIFLMFYIGLVLLHLGALFTQFKHKKTFKKLQVAQPLYSIMALPSLFLYMTSGIKPLLENKYFFIVYWFLALLFNIAGCIVIYNKKNQILEHSKFIL